MLFHDGLEDYFRERDPDAASRKTFDTSNKWTAKAMRRAFLNCTREVLARHEMHSVRTHSRCLANARSGDGSGWWSSLQPPRTGK